MPFSWHMLPHTQAPNQTALCASWGHGDDLIVIISGMTRFSRYNNINEAWKNENFVKWAVSAFSNRRFLKLFSCQSGSMMTWFFPSYLLVLEGKTVCFLNRLVRRFYSSKQGVQPSTNRNVATFLVTYLILNTKHALSGPGHACTWQTTWPL